jgi:hypothetical protein
MNTKNLTINLIILFSTILGGCTPLSAKLDPKEPASNFGFIFEFGSCNLDVLDTISGSFTRDMIVEQDIIVPMALSDTQMRTIYQTMMEIGFFDYPEVFAIPTPKNETFGIVTPAMEFRIMVINGDLTKKIYWKDEIIDLTTPEADHLRTLFMLIIQMIQETPIYQELPQPKLVCV